MKIAFLLFKDSVPLMKVSSRYHRQLPTITTSIQARGGGAAVFISSIGGYQAIPSLGPYSVSKTALLGLTKALATETAVDNIRVNCVAPGVVR